MLHFENRTKQGNIGLTYCITYYTIKGFPVSIPLNDSQKYDLIVDNGERLLKIQVKTTRFKKSDNYQVQLRTISGNKNLGFDPTSFDILFVLTEDKELYEIPSSILSDYTSSISLNEKFSTYKVNL